MALPTSFRDHVVITRPGSGAGGHWDPTTRVWVPGDEDDVVYDGKANVQAGGLIMASRRSTSNTYADADGRMSVPPRKLAELLDVAPEDVAHISYATIRRQSLAERRTASAIVRFVIPESREALLRYT